MGLSQEEILVKQLGDWQIGKTVNYLNQLEKFMRSSTPFSRSIAMMAAISAFLAQGFSSATAFEKVGTYHSRGKGRARIPAKRVGRKTTSFSAQPGKRQIERNVRQGLHMATVKGFQLIQRERGNSNYPLPV
jgi:hypothetical protein